MPRKRTDFYSYTEAQTVSEALGIKCGRDYQASSQLYSRLPVAPEKFYAGTGWTNWYAFLGKEKRDVYSTYTEAQVAAQALSIRDQKDYKAHYQNDPRLPSHPDRVYASAGWIGWHQFLGKDERHLFTTYTEAQAAAQTLGIRGMKDYQARYREHPRLPAKPYYVYAGSGWVNWYDFLGKEKSSFYATYAEAQSAVQSLGFKNRRDYLSNCRQHPRLHYEPHKFYSGAGWTNWYDFLGKKKSPFYATYAEAQKAAQTLGVTSSNDYKRKFRNDPKLPCHPETEYAEAGWTDWHKFLGRVKRHIYITYKEAQAAAQAMGIRSIKDYQAHYADHPRLPAAPHHTYARAGWRDWYDFLGNKKPDLYPTYNEAQVAAQSLDIKSAKDYRMRRFQDPRLPTQPCQHYMNAGWMDWYEFLGNEKSQIYTTYAEAQTAAKMLCLKSRGDYRARYRQDPRLPHTPNHTYANAGWTDWYDFLGKTRTPIYATYAEAQAAAQALGIKGQEEYLAHYRRDPRLRRHPEVVYAFAGWENWYEFLGNEKRDLYPTYDEAQATAQAMRCKSRDDYRVRFLKHPRLPSNPNQCYAGAGWIDWHKFLGNEKAPFYPTYLEAQAAAQELGVENGVDYRTRHQTDPRLPANPQQFYADAGWTDWYTFLGKEKREFYPTYAEAESAAQAMGIKGVHDYYVRYRLDPMLPATPSRVYAETGWTDWHTYLGKTKKYSTYAEAQLAAQALGIKGCRDYLARFRENPRLPVSPASHYAKTGWTDWYEFLGRKKRSLYITYAEAQAAVYALGVKSIYEYRRCRQKDSKLPANPFRCYAELGWKDWYDFLGTENHKLYVTYSEAQTAVQALGAKGQKDYHQRYREDPKLPSNPEAVYSEVGWVSWYDFLGTEKPLGISPDYPRVWSVVQKWLEDETNLNKKTFSLKLFLSGYLKPQGIPDDPKYLLLRTTPFNIEAYQQFIEAQAESTKRSVHSAITAFFKWVLNEHCTDITAEERNVLPIYRNPFETILAGYADSLQFYRPNESTKVVLGYEYILRARRFLVPNGEQALQSRPTLKDLPHLQTFFDSDWMEVDESQIDQTDPNCVWRFLTGVLRVVDGERQKIDVYQIWSPVRFLANYTLLRLPLRGQQIMWLDSGEADDEIAVLDAENANARWVKNIGPLAGKGSKKRRPQGVIQRGYKGAPNLYVTTNKTGRREGGYEVEWIPDELVYWFVLLRNWQAKYNPLTEPTPWLSLEGRIKANSKILKARGTQCFLFRTDSSGRPLSAKTAFDYSLPALLYQIQREGENLAAENRNITGLRFITPYTPHSLRVSLITAFIVDGDAPIHLMSKLVGHSSLVMTIYYIKLNSEQMRRTMGETEKRAAQIATERQCETVRTQGLHPLRQVLIATDGNRSLIENDVPNSACVVFDWGICPMSAAACHMGGELLHERKGQKMYGAVEAGYLGQKNCLRCRFFITGIPFLAGLVALANEIALEIHTESGRFQGYAAAVVALEQEFYDTCQANKPDMKQSQRKQAIANEQQSAGKLDSLLTDYAAINHYVQSCLKLIRKTNQSGERVKEIRLIISGDLQEIGVAVEESRTQYHLLAEICQNATIYQSANPSRAIPLISQAIDRMAENNNLAPAMFRLTDEQKLVVIKELNELLLERLGSWERIEDLFSGDLMLLDIDAHEPKLTRISMEIQNLLLHGATHPLNHELKRHE